MLRFSSLAVYLNLWNIIVKLQCSVVEILIMLIWTSIRSWWGKGFHAFTAEKQAKVRLTKSRKVWLQRPDDVTQIQVRVPCLWICKSAILFSFGLAKLMMMIYSCFIFRENSTFHTLYFTFSRNYIHINVTLSFHIMNAEYKFAWCIIQIFLWD